MFLLHSESGGKDYAKQVILKWLERTGGSNLRFIEQATGLPDKILEVLLNELITESSITYEECYRGVKIYRVF